MFRDEKKTHFLAAVPWAKIILRVSGIKVDVKGIENVAPHIPRIYMTNHQSAFDIFALLAHLPVDFKFIMKQELMRIPLLGIAMKKAGYIGIERDDPREAVKSLKRAQDKIRSGASVLIFPEGTRSLDGRLQEFKKGGFKLALRSGVEIVPICIKDSYKIVPKGSLRIRKGSFKMTIGRPISVKEYGGGRIKELMERVRREMEACMKNG
jgi:1-acyl-sn-glycerol-3-phosphate acyltransferase